MGKCIKFSFVSFGLNSTSWLKIGVQISWVWFCFCCKDPTLPPTRKPPLHSITLVPSLMWGCIWLATPSAHAVLLPVCVGSQLLRAFVLCLLPAQPFVITTLWLGGGRSVVLLPPSQIILRLYFTVHMLCFSDDVGVGGCLSCLCSQWHFALSAYSSWNPLFVIFLFLTS